MHGLIVLAIRILEFLFVLGWAGSAIVLVLSGIEDIETVFEKSDATPPGTPSHHA